MSAPHKKKKRSINEILLSKAMGVTSVSRELTGPLLSGSQMNEHAVLFSDRTGMHDNEPVPLNPQTLLTHLEAARLQPVNWE